MNPLRYRGYYYDNETGYYYLQSRYYDPELGRFISADDFSYIDASEKFSINAYAYCANNPLIYTDPTGCTSELTVAVGEIISAIFLCWDAFLRAGKNFATIIASQLVLDKSIFYQQGATKKEKNDNFKKWYNNMYNDFQKLAETTFYKILNFINEEIFIKYYDFDFFLNFFEESISKGIEYYTLKISNVFTIVFGIGNNDGLLSSLLNMSEGKFEIMKIKDLSSGLIYKKNSSSTNIGMYIESLFYNDGNFYGGISFDFDLEIDLPNINNGSGFAVNTEFLQGAFMFAGTLILVEIFTFLIKLVASGALVF